MNNLDTPLTSCIGKRRANSFYNDDEYEFQIKKKSSLLSTDTTDSLSRDDALLSPTTLKNHGADSMHTPDHGYKVAKDKLSALKRCQSSKKHKSAHLNSYDEIRKNYMSDAQDYVDTFKMVKFKNIKYSLNSCMLVRNETDVENDFVCKLLRIIRPKKVDAKKILAFLEVQWYYRKNDLPKKYAYLMPHISANEVFLSPHKDFIMVDCINGPCEILTLEAYDQLTSTSNNVFYTRAAFDTLSKKLDPPAEQWKKHCVCKTPMNPDLLYIQCDKCNGWFHTECIHISYEEAEAADEFVCMICSGDPNAVLPKEFEFKNHHQRKRKNSHRQGKKSVVIELSKDDMKISENTISTLDSENKEVESDCNSQHSRKSNPLFPADVETNTCGTLSPEEMRMGEALKSLDDLFQALDHSDIKNAPIDFKIINLQDIERNSVSSVRMEIDFSEPEENEEDEEISQDSKIEEEDENENNKLDLEPDLKEDLCKEFFDNFEDNFQQDPIEGQESFIL